MGLTDKDVLVLACPACRGTMKFSGEYVDGEIHHGNLECDKCRRLWKVRDGLPHLVDEQRVEGRDRYLRLIYDLIAPFHDLGVRFVLPAIQFPDSRASRKHYIDQLELDKLVPDEGRPPRVLEVGVGTGANLPLLDIYLPLHVDVEIWGVDLSRRMIDQCRRSARDGRGARLALADAHVLPFPDASFDRVFHVGAINGYRDPQLALAEMARVAKPGTPIVVVDERLDPGREHLLVHRIAFRALTAFDSVTGAPTGLVPDGAEEPEVTVVSRFYYCMKFRVPA